MGAKPKAASWWSRNKKFVIVAGISVFVIVLLGFLFYQSQRPNYRDLEKEFSKLQIPSDWILVSQSGTKGFKGMFCFTSGIDEACPTISRIYQLSGVTTSSDDKTILENLSSSLGGKITDRNFAACVEGAERYYCSVNIESSVNIAANIGINESGKKILYIYTE